MTLTDKFRKLVNGEALKSAFEHGRRCFAPVNAQSMLARLNPAEVRELARRYASRPPGEALDSDKFANAAIWIGINVERAQDLGLAHAEPRRILDLGCGAGYFLYVTKCLGHHSLGLDLDELPVFREALAMLNVERRIWRIEPFVPLPDFGERYDLVTAHRICFHKTAGAKDGTRSFWGPEQWEFFLQDVQSRLLRPGGRVVLDFNPLRDGSFYAPDVARLFVSKGGKMFRSKVIFTLRAKGGGA